MFSSFSRRRIAILLALTSLLLVTLDQGENQVIAKARNVFSVVLHPFETAAEVVARPIERVWDGITKVDDLQRENQELRDRLANQRGAEVQAISAQLQLADIQKLTGLTRSSKSKVALATVIGDAPGNFQNTVEIDLGANAGLRAGMPVTDGFGLVGRIRVVKETTAIVLLITDPEFSVKAEVLQSPLTAVTAPRPRATTATTKPRVTSTTRPRSTTTTTTRPPATSTSTTLVAPPVRETGTLTGRTANRPLVMRFIDDTASSRAVRVGAIVQTAGGSNSLAPQGIPIGVVTKVAKAQGGGEAVVEVTPNGKLTQLKFVAVVLFVPNPTALGT